MDYSLYPLGILGVKNPSHQDYQADLDIDALWKIYEGRVSDVNMKALMDEVLAYVKFQFQPFGGLNGFIELQAKQGKHTLAMASFLEDTVRYIETGKRRVSIASWDYVLLQSYQHPDTPNTAFVKDSNTVNKKKQYAVLPKEDDPYFIAKWISYPDGFKDMLWTLRILFGSVGKE